MVNPVKGQVAAKLGDLDYTLEYSIDAICQLEARLAQTAQQVMAKLLQDNSLTFKRALLWAALLEHHNYDERAAGELLRLKGGTDIAAKLIEAWFAGWPDAEEDGSAKAPPPRRAARRRTAGTGAISTGSGAS